MESEIIQEYADILAQRIVSPKLISYTKRPCLVSSLPVEIHYRIALYILVSSPTTAQEQPKSFQVNSSGRIKSYPDGDASVRALFQWCCVSRNVWNIFAHGGLCDDIWKMACLRKWSKWKYLNECKGMLNDSSLPELTVESPTDSHSTNDESFEASNMLIPLGFWRNMYVNETKLDAEYCTGVHSYFSRSLDANLIRYSNMNAFYDVDLGHHVIGLKDSGIVIVTRRSHVSTVEFQAHLGKLTALIARHGVLLTAGEDDAVRIWDYDGVQQALVYCTGMSIVTCGKMNTDYLVLGDKSGFVRIFDRCKYQVKDILFGLEKPVFHVLFNKDHVIACDISGCLVVWELSHGNMRFKDQLSSPITAMVMNEGRLVVGCQDGRWTVYNCKTWRKENSGYVQNGSITCVQYKEGVICMTTSTSLLVAVYLNAVCDDALNLSESTAGQKIQVNERHDHGSAKYLEIALVHREEVLVDQDVEQSICKLNLLVYIVGSHSHGLKKVIL